MSKHQEYIVLGVLFLTACGGGGELAPSSATASVTFSRIGFVPGTIDSRPSAVSGNGLVVVGSTQSTSGKSLAFRWTQLAGISSLGLMEFGSFSNARAVSTDGSVIVGDGDTRDSSSAVFRWATSTGLMGLGAPPSAKLCVAGGVSGDGNSVVGTCLLAGNSGFHWTEQTGGVSLGQFGGGNNRASNALAISSDGGTVVGVGHPVLTGAVVWNLRGETRLLGALPGDVSAGANSVSRDGSVVAGYSIDSSSHQRAFRWTPLAGMAVLAPPADTSCDVAVSAVSGDGSSIVGWCNAADGETAMLWDEAHGMRRIIDLLKTEYKTVLADWTLSRATGISIDGRTVVGVGINPGGQTEGWVLKFQ
jgi:probable HAF family extracellular repeat protein